MEPELQPVPENLYAFWEVCKGARLDIADGMEGMKGHLWMYMGF